METLQTQICAILAEPFSIDSQPDIINVREQTELCCISMNVKKLYRLSSLTEHYATSAVEV